MGFRDDLEAAVYSSACAVFNGGDALSNWGFGLRVGVPTPVGSASVDLLKAAASAAGLFCNSVPPMLPPSPFSGGQCAALYRVSWVWDRYFNGQLAQVGEAQTAAFSVQGPISSIKMAPNSAYPVAQTASGDVILFSNSSGGRVTYSNLRDIVVVRADGKPDECGNPAPQGRPLTEGERTTNIDIGGSPTTIVIGDGVLVAGGDIVVPISVDSPDFSYSGEINMNKGDISFNFGGGSPSARPCPELGREPENEPPPDTQPPPEEEEKIIVGVLVVVSSVEEGTKVTRIEQEENPDIYVPRLGHVSFRLKLGSSYGWTSDVSVKNRRQYVPVPHGQMATEVKGTPLVGVVWTLTPIMGVSN